MLSTRKIRSRVCLQTFSKRIDSTSEREGRYGAVVLDFGWANRRRRWTLTLVLISLRMVVFDNYGLCSNGSGVLFYTLNTISSDGSPHISSRAFKTRLGQTVGSPEAEN